MTESIDFQNGFVCGMATKGLIKTGAAYEPTCWNDEGEYSYFYIDFHRALDPFSMGMFAESIIVFDSQQLAATGVEKVSSGVYKVYCNINDMLHGVTVMNKKTSLLTFKTGSKVSPFSVHFYVLGQASYTIKGYVYDPGEGDLSTMIDSAVDDWLCTFPVYTEVVDLTDSGEYFNTVSASDTLDISYWEV